MKDLPLDPVLAKVGAGHAALRAWLALDLQLAKASLGVDNAVEGQLWQLGADQLRRRVNDAARQQVATDDLARAIGEADVQVQAGLPEGPHQRDDFKWTLTLELLGLIRQAQTGACQATDAGHHGGSADPLGLNPGLERLA